jgi:hypothetical protein
MDRFCNLVYFWLVRNQDEDGRRELDTQLFTPPPGQAAVGGPWSPEAEMEAFVAAQRATSAV